MKIVMGDPDRLMADALSCILSTQKDIEVVAKSRTAEATLAETGRLQPDMVIVSARFKEAAELIKKTKESYPGAAVLVVGGAADWEWAIDAGAAGYIGTESSGSQLVETVRKVQEGEFVVCGVSRSERSAHAAAEAAPATNPGLETLTTREREVLTLLSRGFSNREIAGHLYLSEHTIRTHVQNLRSKLNVRSKFQAAVLAMQAGGTPVASGGFRF